MVWELEFNNRRAHFSQYALMQQSIEATFGVKIYGPVCSLRYADGAVEFSFATRADPDKRVHAKGRPLVVWDEPCVLADPA